ncbi:uroporphyrinogen-III synthase [Pseudogemmobacter bohemicus]|uniref:uroporphyrinogen-III synthase n=1 Tax=Pseudogemmobacter bohemicus TaxID=2250708 RepID=UPI00130092AB|nr:uroporphyrinogen-III synthase [Pseudogemmobacter bohemicus]
MPPQMILNTRPEPQASRFATELGTVFGGRAEVLTAPLMRVEFLPLAVPRGDFQALVLTSEAGALAAQRLLDEGETLPKRAFCVGDRTAEVADQAGLETVSARGDAGDLVRLITSHQADPLLYLHGEDRAADLQAALAPLGRRVVSLVGYRQQPQALTVEARAALASGRRLILPLFSPRSVRIFLAEAGDMPLAHLQPVVISENARLILPEPLAARAELAVRPDGPSMIAAIARCFPPPVT